MGSPFDQPEFSPLLPPGFHRKSFAEIRTLCGTDFPSSKTRPVILVGLEGILKFLNASDIVGEIWIDGSFLTRKIDPPDADILLRISSKIYDFSRIKQDAIAWATDENRRASHLCDSYLWVEYAEGHPLYQKGEDDRLYWSAWFGSGKGHPKTPKGIAIIPLPAVFA